MRWLSFIILTQPLVYSSALLNQLGTSVVLEGLSALDSIKPGERG